MLDQNHPTRRMIVETIEDDGEFPVVEKLSTPQAVLEPRPWQPGKLREDLARKLRSPDESSGNQTQRVDLPSFLQVTEAASASVVKKESPESELLDFKSFATVIHNGISNMQSIVMSVPAFLTIAVVISVVAFFAGRISTGVSKQADAQVPAPTVQPVGFTQNAPSTAPVQGTPDDIIKAAREQFVKAIEASKKQNQTDAEKTDVSNTILHVLDSLTKGINAYPDVASLYFERAQVGKMVMQSAPTLKNQADADYKKAIELSPLSADYYIGYADYFDVQSDETQALANYQKALSLDPKNVNALYPVAKIYVASGRKDEALNTYKQIATLLSPSSPQYTQVQQEMMALMPPAPAPSASQSAVPSTPASSPTATSSAHP